MGGYMRTAVLTSGKIVNAWEYDENIHGSKLFCMDASCKSEVFFVGSSANSSAHFKTSGKNESKHKESCGFYKPLNPIESIKKIKEYQSTLPKENEITIRLNMNSIDPDYESKPVEREKSDKPHDDKEIKVKNHKETPQSISSVKAVVKLLSQYDLDLLSMFYINVGNNKKLPLSMLVLSQSDAHELNYREENIKNGYFIYGTVYQVTKLEKVMYISLEKVDDIPFTVVIFEKHWKHFRYSEGDLKGKNILIYGQLRRNVYGGNEKSQIIIKSDKYIGFI